MDNVTGFSKAHLSYLSYSIFNIKSVTYSEPVVLGAHECICGDHCLHTLPACVTRNEQNFKGSQSYHWLHSRRIARVVCNYALIFTLAM